MAATAGTAQTPFERTLAEFKSGLKKRDQENFRLTTLKDLEMIIANLQAEQHRTRRLQNLNRLKPFLEGLEQYGKVVEVFCNSSEVVAFIWGPIKVLLQISSAYVEAFTELLDTYEHIGEALPLLQQYQDLFHTKPHMVRVLSLMYEDILKFHRIALRYFQQPLWRQIFSATWKTYKSRFSGIIANLARHRHLIESQANLAQIEESQYERRLEEERFNSLMENEERHRLHVISNWLKSTDVEADQTRFRKIRTDHPTTGRWLLQDQRFQDWFNPQHPAIPPLLWLCGIPGAGKTILASMVVDEARILAAKPTVLFFYCKHGNNDRNNFTALARSFLAQILKQDRELLNYFYQECCDSGEAVLSDPALMEKLLNAAFTNCRGAYIVIDGLDECPRDERKTIANWFRNLVESLPNSEPERLRCLFISQDDGVARRDLAGLSQLKMTEDDNKQDIREFSRVEAERLKETLPLTDERVAQIAAIVVDAVKGMFLFAKFIWINLRDQSSLAALDNELEPGNFPKEIYDAYRRIMTRIEEQPSVSRQKESMMLLGWLAIAKRDLRWFEIQTIKSIDPEGGLVNFERRKFHVEPKDLCMSLVERRSDDVVEFAHATVKLFLLEEGYITGPAEELKMATLCVDYLNLPMFQGPGLRQRVHNGEYGFMDYAVLYWVRHLEADIEKDNSQTTLVNQLSESLEVFLELHWNSPTVRLSVSKKIRARLQHFDSMTDKMDQLEQAVTSARKHLSFYGKIQNSETALKLPEIVRNVRKVLEDFISESHPPSIQEEMVQKYGTNLFKCPRFSCQSFTTGFPCTEERGKHINKHERPFRCTDESCTSYVLGFTSAAEQQKHIRDVHHASEIQDEEFPTDQDIQRSLQPPAPPPESVIEAPPEQPQAESSSSSDTEPEIAPQAAGPVARPRMVQQRRRVGPKEWTCQPCNKTFKKKYNYDSHMRTHSSEKPYKCNQCDYSSARNNDYQRHLVTHSTERRFVCQGFLRNGELWGCQKSFSRADILSQHHRSNVGRECLRPLIRERDAERLPGIQ